MQSPILNSRILGILFLLLSFCSKGIFSKKIMIKAKEIKVMPVKIKCITPQFSIDIPMLDQAKRFGVSNKIGAGYYVKNQKNLMYGGSMNFIFGSQIREDSFVWNIKSPQGDFLSANGEFLGIGFFQRGYTISAELGKILPIWNKNVNSGPMLKASAGYMRYKINIFDRNNAFPQFSATYKKGYDRLTSGLFGELFAGYSYFSPNKKANLYAGLSFVYAANKGRRDFLYDVARSGLDTRKDASIGFKVGYIIPIYKKVVEEKYF